MATLDTVISVTIKQNIPPAPSEAPFLSPLLDLADTVAQTVAAIGPHEAAVISAISVSTLISLISYYPKFNRLYGRFEIESSNIARRISENTTNYDIIYYIPIEIVGFAGLLFYLVNKLPPDEIIPILIRILFISVLTSFPLTERIKWYYCRYLETNTTNLSASSAFKIFNGEFIQNLLNDKLESFFVQQNTKKSKLKSVFSSFLETSNPPAAVSPLIEALHDESPEVRWRAAKALGRAGDPIAISPLRCILMDEYWKVRLWALISLAKLGQAEYLGQITQTLKDEDSRIREEAAYVLGNIVDPWSVEALNYLARKDESPGVRWRAAEALGRIGDHKAVEPLIEALKDEVWLVREEAAGALGEIRDVRAVQPLISLLNDSCVFARWSAVKALGKLGDERAVEPLIYRGTVVYEEIIQNAVAGSLVQIGESAVKPLIKALTNEDSGVREIAAEALGRISDRRAVEPLIEALRDETWWVRKVAAGALGRIGDPRAAEPLSKALKDESEWVRLRAAIALGYLGDPGTFSPLTEALKDKNK